MQMANRMDVNSVGTMGGSKYLNFKYIIKLIN